MKIKVKKEGREGIYIPEKDSLKDFIKSKKLKSIHNFIPNGNVFLGADHEVESVIDDIDRAERLGILVGNMANMGHCLSLISNERLECYDIGKITEKDLDIE